MVVIVVNKEAHKSVIKEAVCQNCGGIMKILLLLLLISCSTTKVYVSDGPLLSGIYSLLEECPEYPFNQNTWKLVIEESRGGYISYVRYMCYASEKQVVTEINGQKLINVYNEKDDKYRWEY